MRKVSFGSFPLTEIRKEDRKCLDRYLIKTFSDNISISDAIRNLGVTKNLMYITPDSLMQTWLGKKQAPPESKGDRASNSLYEETLKRAFYILKEFYSKIKDAPFYKEYVYYPIYVEKIEKVEGKGNESYDVQVTDVTMNYSFVILSNDLTKNLKIDEIRYDENASLNFLFLFVEFFSGPMFNYSIHDFNKEDLEFLVRLYQFIEKSNKEPIQMVLDLYKLLGILQKIAENRADPKKHSDFNLTNELDKFFKGAKIDDLKKYQGMLKHQFVDYLKAKPGSNLASKSFRQSFRDIMESIFSSQELSGLYDGVDSSSSRGQRHSYLYQSNKYREILNLAGELVNYNKLNCKNVISQDRIDMDFKAEHGDRSIEMKSQMAAQKYQTFFKNYVESIRVYLRSIIHELVASYSVDTKVKKFVDREITTAEARITSDNARLTAIVDTYNQASAQYEQYLRWAMNPGDSTHNGESIAFNRNTAERFHDTMERADRDRLVLENNIRQNQIFVNVLKNSRRAVENTSMIISNEVYKEIEDYLISALANDLTFIYDDGKRFFTNEMVAKGLLDLIGTNYDLLDYDKFLQAAHNANNPSAFPEKTPDGKENPAYFTAQIANSLATGFEVMAEDTIAILNEYIRPVLVQKYSEFLTKSIPSSGTTESADNRMAANQAEIIRKLMSSMKKDKYEIPDSIKKNLENEIYKNRFIDHVLKKFERLLNVKVVQKVIDFDDSISQLHPLIKKLIRNGNGECNYFKSFIIDYDMVEQLYRIKYIVDNQKFLDGITNRPPRKFNNPANRMETVLHDYLGLKNNPVWIISRANVYLSMPDDLSLTNTSLMSNIPKADLMKVCQIKATDYWNDRNMGEVAKIGNPKILKLYKDIEKLREKIKTIQDSILQDNQNT